MVIFDSYVKLPEGNPNSRSKHSEIRWMTCWHRFRHEEHPRPVHSIAHAALCSTSGAARAWRQLADGMGWDSSHRLERDSPSGPRMYRFASMSGGSIAGSLIMEHPSLTWIIWGSPHWETSIMAVFTPIMAGGPMGKCTMSQGTCGSMHLHISKTGWNRWFR